MLKVSYELDDSARRNRKLKSATCSVRWLFDFPEMYTR